MNRKWVGNPAATSPLDSALETDRTARVAESLITPITPTTRFCAVYGSPIKHSASPAMQNVGIAALKLDWRYFAFEVRLDNLREAIAGAKAMGFLGLNLTVPHKLLALDLVDTLDATART